MSESFERFEMKGRIDRGPDILKAQYKYGMVLIGLSLLRDFENDEDDENGGSIYDEIGKITKAIAPMLLPMISTLSELEEF